MHIDAFAERLRRNAITHDQDLFAAAEVITLGKQTFAPSRRALLIDLVRQGHLSWTPDVVDSVYTAINAGVLGSFSVYHTDGDDDIDEDQYARAARADIVEAGAAPVCALDVQVSYQKLPEVEQRGTGDIAVWHERNVGSANAHLVNVIEKLQGPTTVITGTSGFDLANLGFVDDARDALTRAANAMHKSGVSAVVSESPEAIVAFTSFADELGIEMPVPCLHSAQWLADRELPVGPGPEVAVTVQDARMLARLPGGVSAVRTTLEKLVGVSVSEMQYAGDQAIPPGPYLGFPHPHVINEMATRRMREAVATGAEVMLTTSPYDERNFSCAEPSLMRTQRLTRFVFDRLEM